MSTNENFRQTICPVDGINKNEPTNGIDEKVAMNKAAYQSGFYVPTPCQNDVLTGYRMKLDYEMAKKKLALEHQDLSYQKRLRFEEELKALNIRYQNYLKMISATVYKDSAGDVIFSLQDGEKHRLASKALLNVSDYRTRIFVSYHPFEQKALEVSWSGDGNASIVFSYTHEGVDPNVFLKRLKKNGVLLLVSGRTEKQAASALLAYSFSSAELVEIPNNCGWNKMGDGTWHYARKNDVTMEEVFKYGRLQ